MYSFDKRNDAKFALPLKDKNIPEIFTNLNSRITVSLAQIERYNSNLVYKKKYKQNLYMVAVSYQEFQ